MRTLTVLEPANATETATSTVLIIDDNAENRLLLSSQLRMEGYRILQASGGYAGIELAQLHDPDIILLDVMMPDVNGFEVCQELKSDRRTQRIPVIMVTALRDVQYRIKGIEVGADEFLHRPHVREELLVRVRTLIQLKHARVELEEERNRLALLGDISRSISKELNLDKMMGEIIAQTQAVLGATKGNIMLLDENGRVSRKILKRAGAPVEFNSQVSQEVMRSGLGGWLVRHNRGDIIRDIGQDPRWVTLPDDQGENGSAIGVPLSRGANSTVGVLVLNHPEVGYFTTEHLALLETIGAQVTTAIENAYLFTDVSEERRKLGTILAQSTDAIIITDEEWRISLFNKAAETFFQAQASKLTGSLITEVPALKVLTSLFAEARRNSESREVVLDNGTILYASISPIPAVGYVAVMQDVTELRRMEALKLEQERKEKQVVKATFSRYMGERLVEHVLSTDPGLMARRERRNAVVMFADIRNWTGGMIAKVEPDVAINQLNEFFTKMMDIALGNDGTVFELTGDELLVGFNAPFDQKNAPYLALKTAITMQHQFNDLCQRWYYNTGTEIGLGIGIDLGEVVVGNVGAESRMSFRMVGAAMNKASRLVDMAEDGYIIISDTMLAALKASVPQLLQRIAFEQMEPTQLKGLVKPQILYRAQIRRPLKEALGK
ncbi:MAG: response regulator [Chloroflexota bacterium]